MKVLVAVKRVVDANVKIRVKPDQTGVDLSNVKMAINPFDEIAVEEALRLKESNQASEVVVVSIGHANTQEQLRSALAMGADRAIQVQLPADHSDELTSLTIAKLLKAVVDQEQPELVILGKQSIDSDNNQTGQMLAAITNRAQGTFVSEIKIDQGMLNVTREIDGGLQEVALKLPAVVTTDLRLNEPRYASLPNIMKAKRKPLDVIEVASLSIDLTPSITTIEVIEPAAREAGIIVPDVATLIEKLSAEQGVI
jgi:electron transfer flavoprotein beta subunit